MQNKGGRQLASSLPTTGKITRYKAGDTLISNIRPYFKKIWYAPFEGTCSGDVIVFRAIMRNNVLLPQPEGPSNATNSPE